MSIRIAEEDSKIENFLHKIERIMEENNFNIMAMNNILLITCEGKVYKIMDIKMVSETVSSVILPRISDSEKLVLVE
jgi:hypothetical protein